MSLRHPIIEDRGERKLDGTRYLCRSRNDSRTAYAGETPQSAYAFWADRTRAGRWHRHKHGFSETFVKKAKP